MITYQHGSGSQYINMGMTHLLDHHRNILGYAVENQLFYSNFHKKVGVMVYPKSPIRSGLIK